MSGRYCVVQVIRLAGQNRAISRHKQRAGYSLFARLLERG